MILTTDHEIQVRSGGSEKEEGGQRKLGASETKGTGGVQELSESVSSESGWEGKVGVEREMLRL